MAMLIENEVMCLGKSQRFMEGKEVIKGARCVKRQRREHAAAPKIGDEGNKMPQQQVGENSTTNTSKRSSRFRGVSRLKNLNIHQNLNRTALNYLCLFF